MSDLERALEDTLGDDRWALTRPPGAVARLRKQVRVRRFRNRAVGSTLGVALLGSALALVLSTTRDELGTEQPAAPSALPVVGAPGVLRGVVTGPAGAALVGIAVLPADSRRVAARTGAGGFFEISCQGSVVVASYAPSPVGGEVFERSPGVGNYGWQRVNTAALCGQVVTVRLLTGGAVEGRLDPIPVARMVRLTRLPGGATTPGPGSLVFVARLAPDGSFRVEGLDTGRYRVEETGELLDVGVGRTVTAALIAPDQ